MRFIAVLCAVAVALVVGFWAYPRLAHTDQVRYRITVRIDTPSGIKTGSGVWAYSEAPVFDVPVFSFSWYFSGRIEGEAIPIDLGGGKTAYAVLGTRVMPQDNGGGMRPAGFISGFSPIGVWRMRFGPLRTPAPVGSRAYAQQTIAWAQALAGQQIVLRCTPILHGNDTGDCPALALISGPNAERIKLLDPDDLGHDLGSGYQLLDMTMEVVRAPVTNTLSKRMPWVRPATWDALDHGYDSPERQIRATALSRRDPPAY